MLGQSLSVLRLLDKSDLDMVLSWRNSPAVCRFMFNTSEISFQDHSLWFSNESHNPNRHLLILELDGTPHGFVNLLQSESLDSATWGFYAAPSAPKGTGRAIGQATLTYCHEVIGLKQLIGEVLSFNQRSIRLHQYLGFSQARIVESNPTYDHNSYETIIFSLDIPQWYLQNKSKQQ